MRRRDELLMQRRDDERLVGRRRVGEALWLLLLLLVDALLLPLLSLLLLLLWAARGLCCGIVLLKMHVRNFGPHVSAFVRICPQKMRTSASCPHLVCTVSACVRILYAIFFTILSCKGTFYLS